MLTFLRDKPTAHIQKKMKNKTIQYEELIKRNAEINELKRNGMIIIPKKNFKVVGWVFIGLGVLTIPIPFTTLPLILIGLFCLGLSKQELTEKIRLKYKRIKYNIRNKLK